MGYTPIRRTIRASLRFPVAPFVAFAFCGGPQAGSVVTAPTSPSQGRAPSSTTARPDSHDELAACASRWKLEASGGESRVVVVCKNDVQRQSLEESREIAQTLFPALDPAQERVCGCTARLRPPPFIDLVFTAKPDEGRVTVQATAEDDLDPELGPAFIACVGTVTATFAPTSLEACPGGKASLIYPVRLELAR